MIHNPQSGGIHLPTLISPAGAGQILSGYQAINADGEIVTGTIPSQGAQTITPGTSAKTIAAGRYLSGTQTISGDTDLVPANIKSGVNIFGVSGSYSGKEPVYGIYNNPAPYVDISNSGDLLSSLKITLPTPIAKVLGLGIMFYADGYRCLMSYPATDSTRNDAPYLSEPDEEALWGVYFMELSGGSITASFCMGQLSVSGSTITITSRSQQVGPIPAIESIYQMAYMYLPT